MEADVFLQRVLILDLALLCLMAVIVVYRVFIAPRGGKFQRLAADALRFFLVAMLVFLAWCLIALACFQLNLISC